MKLVQLTLVSTKDYNSPVTSELPILRSGTVEFQGENGKMSFTLTLKDITDIEQLLRVKCKSLAGEA